MTLLQKLTDAILRREEATRKSYGEIVEAIADGGKLDIKSASAVLHDAGKSADDVAADAELLRRRREWQEELEVARAAATGAPELDSQLHSIEASLDAELKRVRRSHAKKAEAVQLKLNACAAAVAKVDRLERQLAGSAPGWLREAERSAIEESLPVSHELQTVRDSLRRERELLKSAETSAKTASRDAERFPAIPKCRRDASKAADQVTRLRREIAALEARLGELEELQSQHRQAVDEAQQALLTA